MSLKRDTVITPAIEQIQKLTIEKREIESNMAFTEPGMESYQRRIMKNLNRIHARIEEYKKIIRDGYILKVIKKKKYITRYNEILNSIEAPEISYDSVEIGSDVEDRRHEGRKMFVITDFFEEIKKLRNDKKEIESMMVLSEQGDVSYQRRIMQNLNSIDARIEECKTIIRDEFIIRTMGMKKDIARYNQILRLIKAEEISYDSIEIGVEGGILLPPSAMPSGIAKAEPIGPISRGGGKRRKKTRKKTIKKDKK